MGFAEKYGREPLDFSVNVNPLGMCPKAKEAAEQALARGAEYPDTRYRRLCKAISGHYGVPPEFVIPGNGAADLIWRIAAMKSGARALLTAPAFSEYESALSAFGCKIRRHVLLHENGFALTADILPDITPDLGVLFLCNPNNPTGKTVNRELLLKISARCREFGVLLCVDECFNGFLDNSEQYSLRNQLHQNDNLLIIGALTKLYAMAGLRLGFALCANRELRERLWASCQSWPVSVVAEEVGIAALRDETYLEHSLSLLHAERLRLKKMLERFSLEVIGGEANYLFFHTDIPAFGELLAKKGLLIRDCSDYQGLSEGYYRISIRMPAENDRLIDAIKEVKGQ